MKLRRIFSDVWDVWAICAQNGEDVIAQLDMPEADLDAALALFVRVAGHERGPSILPDNRNHAISDDPKILQLSIDKFRFAYFFDGRKIIIVCHAFGRHGGKSGKTARSDIKVARANFAAYFAAKADTTLEYED